MRADCPILIYNSLLERECLHLSDEESPRSEDSGNDEEEQENPVPSNVTSISLEEELEKAIKTENYELAAKIRDQINVRNQNQ